MICKSRRRMKCRTCLACTIALCFMTMGLTGCSDRKVSDKPAINIEPYAMTVHERATVKEGNISSQIKLTLKPDGFSSKDYSVKQDDFEVDQINVKNGDKVKKGDVMISFKADEINKTIDEYTRKKEEDQLLIDHYSRLMGIDSSNDYSEDIKSLKEDIELSTLYIQEQQEKLKEYQVIAEADGIVTYVNEWLEYGYASADETLVSVASGSDAFIGSTEDLTYEFNIGDVFTATQGVATYDMKLVDVEQVKNEATGGEERQLKFECQSDIEVTNGYMELEVVIDKPVISNVTYVDKSAVKTVDGTYYVYRFDEDGYREIVPVEVGDTVDNYVIIKSGLNAGEQVSID
ncbi:MAG: efflux RND transporter periplasmic adaptor subunit [Coprococcus sp.]|nr:efflux RND transporter periplasmic adaptor subunit [Coprococcus sp.]